MRTIGPGYPRTSPGNRGFTVLEAVVYASLALLVIGLAVSVLGNQQKFAMKSQHLAQTRGDAGETIALMTRDLRNAGLKRLIYQAPSGALIDTQLAGVDYAPADSSSLIHREGPRFDTLTFIKPVLDASDKPTGIDTITYAADPATGSLTRTRNRDAPVPIGERVDGLQFQYRVSANRVTLFNEDPPALAGWLQNPLGTLSISNGMLAAARISAGTSSFWLSTTALNLSGSRRYALDINCQANKQLLANADSLTAMICSPAGTPIETQTFLPDLDFRTVRIEFAGLECQGCRAGIRMHMRGGGRLLVASFRFSDIEQGDGQWVDQPTIAQKQAVRSVRLLLLTRSGGDVFGMNLDTIRAANGTYIFNDRLGRVLLEEVVAIPNNGSNGL